MLRAKFVDEDILYLFKYIMIFVLVLEVLYLVYKKIIICLNNSFSKSLINN